MLRAELGLQVERAWVRLLTFHSPLAYICSLDLVFVASTVDRVLHAYSPSSLPALKCVSTVA